MSAVANGKPLTFCRITIPWSGCPTLEAASQEEVTPASGLVTTLLGDLSLVATLLPARSGMFAGGWAGFGVGGRNGWGKYLPAKGYRSPFGVVDAQVFADAAREAGELPPVVQAPQPIGGGYVRRGDRVASQVFAKLPGSQLWWVDPATGVTQVGLRPPRTVTAQFDLIANDTSRGRLTVATDSPAQFVPGATFIDPNAGAFVINAVVWTSTEIALRGEVWVQ